MKTLSALIFILLITMTQQTQASQRNKVGLCGCTTISKAIELDHLFSNEDMKALRWMFDDKRNNCYIIEKGLIEYSVLTEFKAIGIHKIIIYIPSNGSAGEFYVPSNFMALQ